MKKNDDGKDECRELNVIYNKSGNGYYTSRLSIPIVWLRDMGITQDNRQVIIKKIGNQIIIEKLNNN